MTRQLPIIIAFGLASAVLYASALGGFAVGFLVTYLAQLPLYIVGLSMGVQAAAIAGAAGIIALVVIGGTLPGLLFALTTALPVTILVLFALRKRTWTDGQEYWYPPGNLLRTTALWCAFVLLCATVALALWGAGIRAEISIFGDRLGHIFSQATGQSAPDSALGELAVIFPGLLAWSWMLMATVNGLLAQAIVKRTGRNLRPSFRMSDIHIPLSWGAMFGCAVAVSYVLSGDLQLLSANLAIIFAYPLLLQGLSVVHAGLASINAWTIGYVAFYVVILFLGWLALAVVALGMAEPVLKLRERLARPKNT